MACGGQRPADHSKGWFFEPTVLTNVSADLDILKDEVFGPVASLVKVESFEEAIEEANRSHFGLGATIYTQDLAEAMRATRELAVGMVWVNAPLLDNDAGPFGGKKNERYGS